MGSSAHECFPFPENESKNVFAGLDSSGFHGIVRRASLVVKTFLFALLLLLLSWSADSLADIPAPRPNTIAISNLTAFPGYRFFYSQDFQEKPRELLPLKATQTFTGGPNPVRLFVEDQNGVRTEWATVELEWGGKTETISIEDVRREGKTIKVRYEKKPGPGILPPGHKGASTSGAFVVSGLSASMLLMLRRRKSTRV